MQDKRLLALLAAFLVTILWSSSYFFNKFAFEEGIEPLTLAGLRYSIAFLTLWSITSWKSKFRNNYVSKLPIKHILLLGITGYVMGQGLQYFGQFFISPTQTSLLLNIGNVSFVAVAGVFLLREKISIRTTVGIIGVTLGVILFNYPFHFDVNDILGIVFVLLSSIGYAVHLSFTRHLVKREHYTTNQLVMAPMGIGALCMLSYGFLVEGIPNITIELVFIVLWLGIVNGSIAFTLWAWSQKYLEAFQSSVINNLMLIEIALLDVMILNQSFSVLQSIGLIIAFATIIFVSLHKTKSSS
ncbi:drug/metabolite transporter (DMT)-like permease [Salirhabdus euzebyi]|uniref:Drug/metabolite transporter (DMT)-like permease n=1 Tax=Salirhabdus euzebyi TaxID=394506 RepID=A0A841Q8I2_9BACI|nr:DMT family transporter [Salirhabdus euzebyi]MBB6454624.1 drug/metabolite transporter (DMT)-like permease [Salirhabdus euzebyi]